jgi:hypothetical protein
MIFECAQWELGQIALEDWSLSQSCRLPNGNHAFLSNGTMINVTIGLLTIVPFC